MRRLYPIYTIYYIQHTNIPQKSVPLYTIFSRYATLAPVSPQPPLTGLGGILCVTTMESLPRKWKISPVLGTWQSLRSLAATCNKTNKIQQLSLLSIWQIIDIGTLVCTVVCLLSLRQIIYQHCSDFISTMSKSFCLFFHWLLDWLVFLCG